jgi:uncharacterized protein YciI
VTQRWLLFYDYVEGIVEKRAPYRGDHLTHLGEWKEDGRLVTAGAVGDPPSGALFVFATDEGLQEFVDADPYVRAGLVTGFRVQPWNVVIG